MNLGKAMHIHTYKNDEDRSLNSNSNISSKQKSAFTIFCPRLDSGWKSDIIIILYQTDGMRCSISNSKYCQEVGKNLFNRLMNMHEVRS